MNNRELINAQVAMRELGKYELPVRLSLKIRQAKRSMDHLAEDVEAERKKLVDIYAAKNDNGTPRTKTKNGIEVYDFLDSAAFNEKLNELMDADAAGMPAPIKAAEFGTVRLPGWIVDGLCGLIVNDLGEPMLLTETRKTWYEIHGALRSLLVYSMPVVVAQRASMALKALEEIHQTRKKLIESYALKDEDGEPKAVVREDRVIYEFGQNKDEFLAADTKLGEESVELKLVQLQASEFPEDMVLPPALLSQLGDLMADLQD